MTNGIWQSLGQRLVYTNVYGRFYQISLRFKSCDQFSQSDYRRTHNFTNLLQADKQIDHGQIAKKTNETRVFIFAYDTLLVFDKMSPPVKFH